MGISITGVSKCALLSVFLTVLFVFVISLLSYCTDMSDTTLTIAVYASVAAAVFAGSLICVKLTDAKALLHALLLTAVYYALLVGATFAINGSLALNCHFFTMTAGIFASGILGAVIGK